MTRACLTFNSSLLELVVLEQKKKTMKHTKVIQLKVLKFCICLIEIKLDFTLLS